MAPPSAPKRDARRVDPNPTRHWPIHLHVCPAPTLNFAAANQRIAYKPLQPNESPEYEAAEPPPLYGLWTSPECLPYFRRRRPPRSLLTVRQSPPNPAGRPGVNLKLSRAVRLSLSTAAPSYLQRLSCSFSYSVITGWACGRAANASDKEPLFLRFRQLVDLQCGSPPRISLNPLTLTA